MGKDSAEFVSKLPSAEPGKKSGLPGFLIAGTVFALGASALVYAQLEWGVLDQILAKKTEQTAVESPEQEQDEKPRIVPARKVSKPARTTTEQATEPRKRSREPATAVSSPAPVAVRRFPGAGDIQKGMSVLSVRQAFGVPDMKTTDSERGRLLERWMYMNRELGAVTVVLMADGKVVSAETTGNR